MCTSFDSSMTLREMRRAGARAFFSRRWFGRAIFATAALYALQSLVAWFFLWARKAIGFSSWTDFAQSKMQALASGLDYTVPSRAVALNLTYASAFETFLTLVFGGVFTYGLTVFVLRMVKDEDGCGYFAGAFGGLARPLGVAWLLFRIQLQVALWSMLFFIPGIVVWYRYRAAWYLKAENPDWSAGRCLAESGRVMKGQKWRCFGLDCSYWLIITALMILATLVVVFLSIGGSFLATWLAPLAMFAIACLGWCVFAGQTVFYLSIRCNSANCTHGGSDDKVRCDSANCTHGGSDDKVRCDSANCTHGESDDKVRCNSANCTHGGSDDKVRCDSANRTHGELDNKETALQ